MVEITPANIQLWSKLGSCGAYGQATLTLPNISDKIVVLTADLCSFSGLERFKNKYPERFFNIGISEQNMLGIAAGLAKEGFIPFASTYATFASMRCADQIKVCMSYMKLGVKLVGLTSGFSVGILGATHISLEDLAVMRSLPNITILSPADCLSVVKAVQAAAQIEGPVYIRLSGTMNNPIVYHKDFDFKIGKAITLQEGTDICIIATGSMVFTSLRVAEILKKYKLTTKVVDMHTIRPLDTSTIKEACKSKLIVTIEEHSKIGGLGSAVAETLSLEEKKPPHLILGADSFYAHAGDYNYLLQTYGLTTEQIVEQILNKMEKK